ncbi:MAG: sulfite exporter TauE/SafE family protein [Mariniblastus sp.]|nr:sulfite exporter TauE/SafE family protein [Mariniblastus sp.]
MIETILGYLMGLVVGIVMGMFGGGGSLLLPAMLYLLHYDLKFATAYTTILVGITALVGVVPRIQKKIIDFPTVIALGIPVATGNLIVRLWLFDAVPEELFTIGSLVVSKKIFVLTIFAGLIFLSSATMLGLIGKPVNQNMDSKAKKSIAYYISLFVCGLLIGVIPGFTGAGGGVLIVPLLVIFFGLPMRTVIGTSLSIVAFKSFVGFFGGDMIRLGSEMDYQFLVQFSILMITGVVIGSWWSQRFDGERLKRIFAWFLMALATFIVIYECFFKIAV